MYNDSCDFALMRCARFTLSHLVYLISHIELFSCAVISKIKPKISSLISLYFKSRLSLERIGVIKET